MTHNYLHAFAKRQLLTVLALLLLAAGVSAQPCQPSYTNGTGFGDWIGKVQLDSIDNTTTGAASPYYTYYSTLSTSVGTGKSYFVKIGCGTYTGTGNNIAVWIDYNQNDTFETSEKLGQKNNMAANSVDSIAFSVPNNATTGKTRMRVREVWNNTAIDPCTQGGYGETEDYVIYVDYVACTSPPTAGTVTTAATNLCSGTPFTLTLTGNTSGAGQTVQWQSTTDTLNWTDISGANANTYSDTQWTTDMYYRCYLVCSGNADTTAWILFTTKAANQCYCLPTHPNCTGGDIITNVNIAGTCLNNTVSACNTTSTNYYYDFTANAAPILTPGQSYDLGVTTNTGNIISVWIDYDQDGQLDASEWNQVTTGSTANTQTTKNITIPATATAGLTRMRIRSRLTGNQNGSGDACLNMGSGVMHDYTVNISPPLKTDVAAGSIVQPIKSLCFTGNETAEVAVNNAGTDTLDMSVKNVHVQLSMTVNAVTTILDTVLTTGVIPPASSFNVIFSNTLDMSAAGATFDFWLKTELQAAPDSQACNDSIMEMRVATSPISQAYTEDFDVTGTVPASYTGNGYTVSANTGVGNTQSLRASMASGGKDTYFYTPLVGPLTSLSTLRFDFRTSNQLSADDSIGIYVSDDCGKTFTEMFMFRSANTLSTSYKQYQVNLDAYSGNDVIVGVANYYASGNTYTVDFDNMAIGERPVVNFGNDTALCGSITLDADPNGMGWDILWNNNSTNPQRTIGATGTYWVKVTDPSSGISGYDTIKIDVYNTPTVNLGNDLNVCPGSSAATLDAGQWPSNYTLLWNTGDTSRTIVPASSGNYSVTVTTPGGCSGSDAINVTYTTRPAGVTISQGSPFNGSFNSGTPDAVCVGNTVTYELNPPSGYSNADFGTKWLVVAASTGMATPAGNAPTTGTVTITAPGNANGKFEFKPTQAEGDSTYTLFITVKDNVTGCDTTVARVVKVNALPSVSLADQTVCPGVQATFDAGNFTSYSWNTGASTQTISVTTPGSYTVQVTDANGCSNTASANLNNFTAPVVNLGADRNICPGNSVTLDAGTFNGYAWSTGATTQTISVNAAGSFSVQVTDGNGCNATDTVSVNLLAKPLSTFSQTPAGLSVSFTPTDQNHQTYHWYFGDGSQSFVKSPTHMYAAFGNYDVALVATGVNGCTDSVSQPLALINGINGVENLSGLSVYPNPYSGISTLQLELSRTSVVSVILYDQLGRQVQTLLAGKTLAAGNQALILDTQAEGAGIYMVQITVDGRQTSLRIVDAGRE